MNRLRDKRAPGHCWQDNELYEVFLPLIGCQAAWVFAVMTRWCYGHRVPLGLRELAEESGVSRSSVQRAIAAMQALGMVEVGPGRGSAPASYDLLDLKAAAIALGAVRDERRSSWVLEPGQAKEIRERLEARLGLRKLALVRPGKQVADEPVCVPQGDTNGGGNREFVSQKEGVCVPQGDASVPKPGSPLISNTQDSKKSTSPLPPSAMRKGESVSTSTRRNTKPESLAPTEQEEESGDELAQRAAVERVMRECGFAGRLRKLLDEVLFRYAGRERMGFDEAAAAMISAWREYDKAKAMLRWPWGPRKFFSDANWLNPDGWPWDRERMERERMARVGS